MENEETKNIPSEKSSEGRQINTPTAIIVAGVLIMIAILITNGGGKLGGSSKEKTLSEQVGVNKAKFTQCMKDTDLNALRLATNTVAENSMKGIPADQRGTPYSVIVGKNGSKAEIRGAYPIADVQKLIDEVKAGKVTTPYTGDLAPVTAEDHIIGNPDAPIVIVEYSDLECPYCKRFSGTMKELVANSNGEIAWVYRHWVVHPGALPKAGAAECVAKLKGNDAFWKYVDLVFGLMKTEEDTTATDNL